MRNTRSTRPIARVFATTCVALVGLLSSSASAQAPRTLVTVEVNGVLDPLLADHVAGVISGAVPGQAVLLTVDVSGGLGSSLRKVEQAIAAANVPVLCYVAPEGAQASAAGAFLVEACPVAAMAPGTSLGPAEQVGLAGAIGDGAAGEAAQMRSLAQQHGRDAGAASAMVTDGASYSAQEALDRKVVDIVATDVPDLLRQAQGRAVTLATGDVVELPNLASAPATADPMPAFIGFLHSLVNPNLAFVFFWLGVALIVLEAIVPGHIFSGTVGTILLLVSIVSFGLLPVRLAGVVLLLASAVLFVIEMATPTHGALGVAGLICLVFGGLLLYGGGDARVSLVVLVPVAVAVALFFGVVVRKALSLRHLPPPAGREAIVGRHGVAIGAGVGPESGLVRVDSEEWQAVTTAGTIAAGAPIRVRSVDGLVLTVDEDDPEHDPFRALASRARRGGNTT